MSHDNLFKSCDHYVEEFELVEKKPITEGKGPYFTGVDLGTAYIVLVVTDENKRIVAGAHRSASVVRDGMVVDYIGAVQIVRELKEELEHQLDTELVFASAAIPPGTDLLDGGAIKNVVQSAGFELTAILDEPTAALDPVAEAEIYSKFNDIVTDKTTVYISHRLSSCKFCDEIAVFHEGNVVQKGTHEELISDKTGKYYELWNAQAQYYNE